MTGSFFPDGITAGAYTFRYRQSSLSIRGPFPLVSWAHRPP